MFKQIYLYLFVKITVNNFLFSLFLLNIFFYLHIFFKPNNPCILRSILPFGMMSFSLLANQHRGNREKSEWQPSWLGGKH